MRFFSNRLFLVRLHSFRGETHFWGTPLEENASKLHTFRLNATTLAGEHPLHQRRHRRSHYFCQPNENKKKKEKSRAHYLHRNFALEQAPLLERKPSVREGWGEGPWEGPQPPTWPLQKEQVVTSVTCKRFHPLGQYFSTFSLWEHANMEMHRWVGGKHHPLCQMCSTLLMGARDTRDPFVTRAGLGGLDL